MSYYLEILILLLLSSNFDRNICVFQLHTNAHLRNMYTTTNITKCVYALDKRSHFCLCSHLLIFQAFITLPCI